MDIVSCIPVRADCGQTITITIATTITITINSTMYCFYYTISH